MSDKRSTAHCWPASAFEAPVPGSDRADPWATWLQAATVTPVSAFGWDCEPAWQVTRRLADDMWFWIQAGTGVAWVDQPEAAEPVGPGDLVLIPRDIDQHVRPDPGVRFTLYTVHFVAEAYGSVDLLSLFKLAGVWQGTGDAPFGRANETLAREYAHQAAGWQQAMRAALWEVLLYALRQVLTGSHASMRDAPARDLARLQPALDALHSRLDDPRLRVGDLAEAVHVSEVYLRKLFRRAFGTGPASFVRRQRIHRACALLRTTDQPIKRVARACGFADLAFFYRAFRAAVGSTPQRYRRHREM